MADESKEEKSPPKKKSKLFKILILILLVLVLGAAGAFYLKGPMFKKVTGMSSQVLRMKIPGPKPSAHAPAKPLKKAAVKRAPKPAPSKASAPQKNTKSIKIAAKQNNAKPAEVDSSSKVLGQAVVPTVANVATTPARSSGSQGGMDYGFEMKRVETLLENDADNSNAIYNRGWLNEHSGNLVSAQEDYSKAIQINGKLADAYFNRGLILIDMKKYDQAVQDFTEVIKMEPRSVDAYCNRGNA